MREGLNAVELIFLTFAVVCLFWLLLDFFGGRGPLVLLPPPFLFHSLSLLPPPFPFDFLLFPLLCPKME